MPPHLKAASEGIDNSELQSEAMEEEGDDELDFEGSEEEDVKTEKIKKSGKKVKKL